MIRPDPCNNPAVSGGGHASFDPPLYFRFRLYFLRKSEGCSSRPARLVSDAVGLVWPPFAGSWRAVGGSARSEAGRPGLGSGTLRRGRLGVPASRRGLGRAGLSAGGPSLPGQPPASGKGKRGPQTREPPQPSPHLVARLLPCVETVSWLLTSLRLQADPWRLK